MTRTPSREKATPGTTEGRAHGGLVPDDRAVAGGLPQLDAPRAQGVRRRVATSASEEVTRGRSRAYRDPGERVAGPTRAGPDGEGDVQARRSPEVRGQDRVRRRRRR